MARTARQLNDDRVSIRDTRTDERVGARAYLSVANESSRAPARSAAGASAPVRPRPEEVVIRPPHIVLMTMTEKVRMVTAVFVLGMMFLGVISLAAYGTSVQREINRINAQAALVDEDIVKLNLSIEKGRNIGMIEQKALTELGMIYPKGTQLKYLAEIEAQPVDLAQTIKEKVYGS
ncbi:MAG: hypothetical protein LBH63_05140 [Clostridiales Family XIII bacterium]|jgi:cell division protein FtsL|nr:hypothetical protein [Clostridiales Family XIII bacterium]